MTILATTAAVWLAAFTSTAALWTAVIVARERHRGRT